jgi:hypothetical protein
MDHITLYLKSQLIWALFFIVLILFNRKNRYSIIISGLTSIPLGFMASLLFNEVWVPGRMFNLNVGIEDFIFCFLSGGISLATVLLFDRSLTIKRPIVIKQNEFFKIFIIGICLTTLLFIFGIRGYLNVFISMPSLALWIILRNKRHIKYFFIGSMAVCMLYSFGLVLGFKIWPDLAELWDMRSMLGITLSGIPIEEFIWAFLFGGLWPVIVLSVIKFELNSNRQMI